MAKLNVEIPQWSWEAEPERERRIFEEILHGTETNDDVASAWYAYLKENLQFPFWTYMIAPNSTATTSYCERIRLTRLASPERCGKRQIVMIGHSSIRDNAWNYYFLADMSKLEAEETTIRAMLDYMYWLKNL